MSIVRPALTLFALMTVSTGIVYPLFVTICAQTFFKEQAEGSLIYRTVDNKNVIVGSRLLGQTFVDNKYFWSRPSATSPAYNAAASSGSNLGPTNQDYLNTVQKRCVDWRKQPTNAIATEDKIPVDLVTASGSGLDPHISAAAARLQIKRVATTRGLTIEAITTLVTEHTQGRQFGFLGEPRVNVLELNLALDKI